MARWTARIKIKHLLEHDDESHAATQRSMSADETRLSRAYDAIYAELERRGEIDNLPARLDAVQFVAPTP